MPSVNKEMTIFEILQKYPGVCEVLEQFGMACCECLAQMEESLEKGAQRHRVDLDALIKELNHFIQENK